MNIPKGKGVWIWQIWKLEGGSVDDVRYDAIVDAMVEAGLSHCYIKIADAQYPYNVKWEHYPYWSGAILEDFAGELADRCHEAGIEPYGWHYVYGYRPLDEARVGGRRVMETGVVGYSIDAEAEAKANGAGPANEYAGDLSVEGAVSLASYRYPNVHRALPWAAYLGVSDYIAQQLYWELAHNPVYQLQTSLRQNRELLAQIGLPTDMPQAPIGSAYARGNWRPTAAEIVDFMTAAKAEGLPSVSFWSYDAMRAVEHYSAPAPELWDAIADFDWPVEPSEPDEPAKPPQFVNMTKAERLAVIQEFLIGDGVLDEEGRPS